MANYNDLDESELKKLLEEAESYDERSLIRQALRQKKKQRGDPVGRPKGRGSVYNRFAGTTRASGPAPKNFVAAAAESTTPQTKPEQKQAAPPSEPYPRPPTPTPPPTPPDQQSPSLDQQPPTPEQEPTPDERPPTPEEQPPSPEPRSPTPEQESPTPEEEPPPGEDETDVPPHVEEEVPPSPPPSPEPSPPQHFDDVDAGTDPGLGEEGGTEETSTTSEPEPVVEETKPTPPKTRDRQIEESDGGAEFQGFKLRKTSRPETKPRADRPRATEQPKVDFGVKLKKATPSKSPPTVQRKPPEPKPTGEAPRTLRDYQQLSARSKPSRPLTPEEEGPPMEVDELHKYLVAYVNKELALHPELPAKGRALFETASNPTNLCKLINKSVPNTVDLRALTKIPVRGSPQAQREALEENMVLVVESARAIGCRVTDSSGEKIIEGDPSTIRQFLVDLIRARVVNMPGMEDEPSSTFANMATLFSKLDISVGGEEEVDSAQESPAPEPESPVSTSEPETVAPVKESPAMTYEERAAQRRAERERKRDQTSSSADRSEMSYEERAAHRRAERERRRREREALAN